jgi:hypothetical protein
VSLDGLKVVPSHRWLFWHQQKLSRFMLFGIVTRSSRFLPPFAALWFMRERMLRQGVPHQVWQRRIYRIEKVFGSDVFLDSPDVVSIDVDTFLHSVHPLEKTGSNMSRGISAKMTRMRMRMRTRSSHSPSARYPINFLFT